MTPKKKKLSIQDVVAQIERTKGNIAIAASSLGVSRQTLYNYIKASPKLKGLLKDAREAMVDAAESALFAAITEKQAWAVCFTLKTLGKSRGYIEKQQIEHSGGDSLFGPLVAALEKAYGNSRRQPNQTRG